MTLRDRIERILTEMGFTEATNTVTPSGRRLSQFVSAGDLATDLAAALEKEVIASRLTFCPVCEAWWVSLTAGGHRACVKCGWVPPRSEDYVQQPIIVEGKAAPRKAGGCGGGYCTCNSCLAASGIDPATYW